MTDGGESSRLTDRKIELSEEEKYLLDQKLSMLKECLARGEKKEIIITFFVPDCQKSGGHYEQYCAKVRKIDSLYRKIIFYADNDISSGKEILLDMVLDIQFPSVSDAFTDHS